MSDETESVEEVTEGTEEAAEQFDIVYTGTNPTPDKTGCIQVIARKDGKEASVYYDYGDDLIEMTEMLGEIVVFSNARSKMKIGLQASLRAYLKAGQDIGKLMEKYKPGVALEKLPTDMNKATEDYFAGLSEDEQDAMITRLMQRKDT